MAVKCREKTASAFADLGTFIFNKEKKEILGRTCQSWTKITGFFLTLYAVLAAIFAVHLGVFLAVTPTAGPDVRPWNFGQYAYPNYPNSKIVLVANPTAFSYSRTNKEAILSETDNRFMRELMSSANASGVSSECLNEDTQYGYNNGLPCVFIHVLRVYTWIPENFINKTLDTMLLNCSFRSTNLDLNITTTRDGIPLNISNDASRSFPFRGQTDYMTPVMAVQLNLTGVPTGNLTGAFTGTITCTVDLAGIGLIVPTAENLLRQFDIPADSTTTITFN